MTIANSENYEEKIKFGKYHLQVSLIVILFSFVSPIVILIMPMMQRSPDFFFRNSQNQLETIPREEFCTKTYYSNNFDQIYDNIVIDYSDIDNWAADLKLVCNTKLIFSLASSIYFIGSIASNYGLSKVPDNYGRRKIFLILTIITSFSLIQLCFLFSFCQIIISSFILGLASLNMSIGSIILNETLDHKQSGLVMGIANAMFPLSGLLNTMIIYFFESWRIYFYFVCLVSILCCILTVSCLKESTKWLKDNGKYTKYIRTIRYIIHLNGDKDEIAKIEAYMQKTLSVMTNEEMIQIEETDRSDSETSVQALDYLGAEKTFQLNVSFQNKGSYQITDLFYYKSLRVTSIISLYLWIFTGFSFYGLLLNLANMTGNIFIDSVVSYTGEFFAEVYSGYLANIYGKKVVTYSLILSCISGILFSLFDSLLLKIPFLFLASMGVSSCFNVLYIFTPQYYPTNIRALGVSFFSLTNRIAACFVPIFLNMFTNIIFLIGILSGIAVVFTHFIPEVLGYDAGAEVLEKCVLKKKSSGKKSTATSFYKM